ncbi:hypothetical protein I317_03264 [Kwoniella heveanensis CBS 569]|uniref:Uncharacterized protein n=1 Tax=Kwoniella heveanensis BCC8398 TaxID=1296120 RepID=A0A1B9H0S6_9TREE|nr:hypothetical protein I316_01466 [Kwoniella heveanensis BCC8398]OCF42913.1 hypothetical protein I317_03264 [Kwoniella heveanensis CBS 569]
MAGTIVRPTPTRIPISALLPPASNQQEIQDHDPATYAAGPSRYFPTTSYVIGPTPRTSAIHLSLEYLSRADRRLHDAPPFTNIPRRQIDDLEDDGEEGRSLSDGRGKVRAAERGTITNRHRIPISSEGLRAGERVLIISGSRGDTIDKLVEEDEDWLRSYGGHFEALQRLRRIDMRYCPTPAHLKLLLALLSESTERIPPSRPTSQAHPQLVPLPSVVILHDLAGSFMIDEEGDENEPPQDHARRPPKGHDGPCDGYDAVGAESEAFSEGADQTGQSEQDSKGEGTASPTSRRKFREGICLSDYMDVLSAAKAAVDHLSSLHPSDPPLQVLILEPNLSSSSSLPILPPLVSENEDPKMSRTNRERRIKIVEAADWIFGRFAVGVIEPSSNVREDEPLDDVSRYTFLLGDGEEVEPYGMIRRPCGRASTAKKAFEDGFVEGEDRGGWQWVWA